MPSKFLLLIVFFAFSVSVLGQTDPIEGPTLKIELIGTELEDTREYYVIKTNLRLTFTNHTHRKILLLNKYAELWGKNVFLKLPDGLLSILDSSRGGNSYRSREPDRRELLSIALPSDKVRELDPGKSFEVEDYTGVLIYKNRSWDYGGAGRKEIMIEDLKGMSSVWMNVSYTYWDPNLDRNEKTGKKLDFQKQFNDRWSKYGRLWTQPIGSQPIEIPLPKLLTDQPSR